MGEWWTVTLITDQTVKLRNSQNQIVTIPRGNFDAIVNQEEQIFPK